MGLPFFFHGNRFLRVITVVIVLSMYNRTDPAQFLVPYDQYMKSAEINYSFGLRFRMELESVEWPEYMNQK